MRFVLIGMKTGWTDNRSLPHRLKSRRAGRFSLYNGIHDVLQRVYNGVAFGEEVRFEEG
jgi:hypothetical protein